MRFGQSGLVGSDLGEYVEFDCRHEGSERTCQLKTDKLLTYAEVID
jgi:hypothetical protein